MSGVLIRSAAPQVDPRSFRVRTNTFHVNIPHGKFKHYDVITTPARPRPSHTSEEENKGPKTQYAIEIIHFLQTNHAPQLFQPPGAYDGSKNLFVWNSRLDGHQSFKFQMPSESDRHYTVTLNLVNTIDPSVLAKLVRGSSKMTSETATAITALNVVVRAAPLERSKLFNSRCFFRIGDNDVRSLGSGLNMAPGFYQSIRPAIGKMLVNIDTVATVVYKHGNLVDVLLDRLGGRHPRDLEARSLGPQIRSLDKFAKGLKVVYNRTHPLYNRKTKGGRPKGGIIAGFEAKSASEYKFAKDGVEVSIADYYQSTYKIHLQLPRIICARFKGPHPAPVVPLELLDVPPGEIYKRDLPPTATTKMIAETKRRPDQRLVDIQAAYTAMAYSQSPYVVNSGLQVLSDPIQAPARLLQPPIVRYGGNQSASIREGSWDIMRSRLVTPATIRAWAVVVYDPEFSHQGPQFIFDNLVAPLRDSLSARGLTVPPKIPEIILGNAQGNVSQDLQALVIRVMAENGLNARDPSHRAGVLLLVILKLPSNALREAVKRFGDITHGIPTQIVVGQKALKSGNPRAKDQYCNNLALKINVKLGGVNAEVQNAWFAQEPTMIIGLDVSHAPPQSLLPSVSAMVSTVSRQSMSLYTASSNVQEARVETITDMKSMLESAVRRFRGYHEQTEKRSLIPSRIVIFRDGVSEGEFEMIINEEIPAIRSVFEEKKAPTPKITFVVCGKRHHMRFTPTDSRQQDKSGNCLSGTVVDAEVVHPVYFDWYLQSQKGLIGTSRSSHYTVVHDDNRMTADQLQRLAFDLTHIYARSTSAVSIPAPVYYADIVCSRLRFHLKPTTFGSETSDAGSHDTAKPIEEWKQLYMGINDSLKNRMYFM